MDDGNVVRAEALGNVEASDFRDRNSSGVAGKKRYLIPGRDFTFARDSKIETSACAGKKALHHVIGLEADAQLVAWEARLRGDQFRGTNGEAVAEMDRVF